MGFIHCTYNSIYIFYILIVHRLRAVLLHIRCKIVRIFWISNTNHWFQAETQTRSEQKYTLDPCSSLARPSPTLEVRRLLPKFHVHSNFNDRGLHKFLVQPILGPNFIHWCNSRLLRMTSDYPRLAGLDLWWYHWGSVLYFWFNQRGQLKPGGWRTQRVKPPTQNKRSTAD